MVTLALGDPRAGASGLSGAFPSAVVALPSLYFLALRSHLRQSTPWPARTKPPWPAHREAPRTEARTSTAATWASNRGADEHDNEHGGSADLDGEEHGDDGPSDADAGGRGEDRKSTRLNSSHSGESRMPSSA